MATLAELIVGLGVDPADGLKGLQKLESEFKRTGQQLRSAGAGMTKALTVPITAAAAGLTALGAKFQDATANIRAGTGATGEALRGLESDFKAALARVPEDIGTVSQALADLNTRTSATGKPLQDLTVQFLNLSRVAGEDVNETIRNGTRLFGDWAVAAEDQTAALDHVWKASQQTGIGVNQLMGLTVQYGAQLRQVGFSLEESVALLGKWEKEGVNTEKILGALSMAVGRFARDGIDARDGLQDMITKIQTLGPGAESTKLAIEAFGSRAGPDLAAAILEGRFELDEMLAALKGSPETIAAASDEAKKFGDQWKEIKNQVSLALEPLGAKLAEALETLKPRLAGAAEFLGQMVDWFVKLPGPIQAGVGAFLALVAAIGPLLTVAGILVSSIGSLIGAGGLAGLASTLGSVLAPIALVVAALVGIGVAVKQLWNENEEFRENILVIWDGIQSAIQAVVDVIRAVWEEVGDDVFRIAEAAWNQVKLVIETVVDVVANVIRMIKAMIQGDWAGVWEAAGGIVMAGVNLILGTVKNLWTVSASLWGGIKDTVVRIVTEMWEAIKGKFTDAVKEVGEKAEQVRAAVEAPFRKLKDVLVGHSIVPDMVADVIAEFETMKGETEKRTAAMVASIVSQFADVEVAVGKLSAAGQRHIEGLVRQQAELAMTEEGYRRFELQLEGVKDQEIEAILEMERHIKATKENRAAVVDLIADLERQAKSLGVATEKTIDQRVAELQLTDAQRQGIAVLRERIAQAEFQATAMKVIEEENKKAAKAEEEHAKAVEAAKGRIETKLKGMITQSLPEWARGWEQHWQLARDVFAVFGEDIGGLLQGLLGKFGGWLGSLGQLFGSGFGGILEKAKGLLGGLGGLFDGGFGGFLGKAGDFVKGFGDKLLGGLGLDGVFGTVSKFIGGPWGMAITGALDLLGIDVGQAVQKIGKVAVDGLVAVGEGIGAVGGAILGGLGDIAGGIASAFGGGLTDAEKIAAAAPGTALYDAAAQFRQQYGRDPTSLAELGRVNVAVTDSVYQASVGLERARQQGLIGYDPRTDIASSQYDASFAAALRGAGSSISRGMASVTSAAGGLATPKILPVAGAGGMAAPGDQVAILEIDGEKIGRAVFRGGIAAGRRAAGIRDL